MAKGNCFSTKQITLAIILSIVILVIAQNLSLIIATLVVGVGIPAAAGNILAGILYVLFTYAGIIGLCRKLLKMPLQKLHITRFRLNTIWVICAIAMPLLVLLISILAGGHWEVNVLNTPDTWATLTGAVVFYGLAAGIVEETIFRGVIMGCLENRFNKTVAIIIPSILFGALHIIGNDLSFLSIIQLLIAGSIVGILFSLITYESNSIWNSAIVHGIWNMAIVGGILHIGSSPDSDSLFNYVLNNKSFVISGGDFGIEASIFSLIVYLAFVLLAVFLIRRKSSNTL